MAMRHHTINSQEVRKRAAEIRQHWSPLEKIQRTGLPPDIPARLRQLFLGTPQPRWSPVSSGSPNGGHHPMRPS